MLTRNDTAFGSILFKNFLDEWGARHRFRCVQVPSGNGIIELCHWTVKRITTRKQCSGTTSLQRMAYPHYSTSQYELSLPHTVERNDGMSALAPDQRQIIFNTVDWEWLKVPNGRCTTKYEIRRVTGVTNVQNVLIDGMQRYVKDLQPTVWLGPPTNCSDMWSENKRIITVGEVPSTPVPTIDAADTTCSDDSSDDDPMGIALRRSTRRKRPSLDCPKWSWGV